MIRSPATHLGVSRAMVRTIVLSQFMVLFLASVAIAAEPKTAPPYEPSAENLAAREAFRDDAFGIFIHWGIYSVKGEGEWVMHNTQMTIEEYEPLAKQFNPVEFDAKEWV